MGRKPSLRLMSGAVSLNGRAVLIVAVLLALVVSSSVLAVAPVISRFTPTSACAGATVSITGTSFTGATAVKFNGVAATSFRVVSATLITAVVPKTTTGKIAVTTPGGTATTVASFTFIPAPTITAFTPISSGAGAAVTITGTNLLGATAVKFNGIAASSFHVVSATSITAVVPKTTTGKITVTTPGGTATSLTSLTFIPAPAIASFTPISAGAGVVVTITGTNFLGATAVKFNGVAATSFSVKSATSITAVVPKTTTGRIAVTTPGGTATSLALFTFIPAPRIASFTPTAIGAGATVTIIGANFTGATVVKFGGVSATSFKVLSSAYITAVVPKTTVGNITVTTPGGTAIALTTFTFVPAPTITSFAPNSYTAGATVTITGTNFTGATAVKFNGVAAVSFAVKSATSITAVAPKTTPGKITVTTPGGTAVSGMSSAPLPAPTITWFTPTCADEGATVAINGTNFTGATSIKFNGKPSPSFTVESPILITASVPAAVTTGKITVTTPAGTASSYASFSLGTPSLYVAGPMTLGWTNKLYNYGNDLREMQIFQDAPVARATAPFYMINSAMVFSQGKINLSPLFAAGAGAMQLGHTVNFSQVNYPSGTISASSFSWPAEGYGIQHAYAACGIVATSTGTGVVYSYDTLSFPNVVRMTCVEPVTADPGHIVMPALGEPVLINDLRDGQMNLEWYSVAGATDYRVVVEPVNPNIGPKWQSSIIYHYSGETSDGAWLSLSSADRLMLATLLSAVGLVDQDILWRVDVRNATDTPPLFWTEGDWNVFHIQPTPSGP